MKLKKEKKFGWVTQAFEMATDIFALVKAESEDRVEELRSKVKQYVIIYGMLVVALFFVIVGFAKYLAEINFFRTEGISFMIVGAGLIVLLALYSLLNKV